MARILIVDDDEDLCGACASALRGEGYDVTTVRSAEAALEVMQAGPFHLLVVDLLLPGIDGAEFCRIIRGNQQTRGLPIVMFSSMAVRMGITISEADARWAPVDRFIEKEGDLSVLVRAIQELLQQGER